MRIKVGQAVRGEDFFNRDREIKTLWAEIEAGSSILISAPRRVGKTSLMLYLHDNPRDGYYIVYIITESVSSENEFFKRLFDEIIETVLGNMDKFFRKTSTAAKAISSKIKSIGQKGIEFDSDGGLNYFEELKRVFISLDLNERLVIMVDEFAQTVENIVNSKGTDKAVHFLQSNRELRQSTEFNENVQFIYAGSIGLENIVSSLNAVNLINDLNPVFIRPLSTEQAKMLIKELTKCLDFSLEEEKIGYVLDKIKWLIPFYIQLIVQELNRITEQNGIGEIDEKLIDGAFNRILEQRNHFEHWNTRLRKAYKAEDYTFAVSILNLISNEEEIDSNTIHDLAVKYKVEEHFKDIIRTLIYDGYINNNDDPQKYRFNSPILRMWWWKNVSN